MSGRLKNITFTKCTFLRSVFEEENYPKGLFDIAIVGRSNVGKSSLINHLLKRKKMAKVSQKPGKTQMLNFFLIDEFFYLVDLPGYGFAKVSKKMKRTWSEKIDTYLEKRKNLKLILFLLDIRRTPSKDDLAFFEWTSFHKIPIIIILTKTDKLKKYEVQRQIPIIQGALGLEDDHSMVLYSIKDPSCHGALIQKIQEGQK